MRIDTVFRVASLSKSVTAWGIMRLVEAGKVDLDKPAQDYLDRWPLPPSAFPSSAVTVRSLLNHTSGLNPGGDLFRQPGEPAMSSLELLEKEGPPAGGRPSPARLVAPAGAGFAYSVPGYVILQMIIEQQSRRPFADYMRAAVLSPLRMNSSSYDWDDPSIRARTASAYVDPRQALPPVIAQDRAADSLYSTGPDIARFVAAALPDPELPAGATVLQPASVNDLYGAPSSIPKFELAGIGEDLPALGYFVEQTPNGPKILTNGGYDPGWSSQFFMSPTTGDGLVVLTNGDAAEPAIAQIAAIWSSWRGLPPMKMTRAYRVLGTDASVVMGLLAMITLSFGADMMIDLAARHRRFGDFHLTALAASALESCLVLAAFAVWIAARDTVETLPTFAAVGTTVISAFACVVIARALFPARVPTTRSAPRRQTARALFTGWTSARQA
jgi:CubicO group peptidase (beta-lactamase class C family)